MTNKDIYDLYVLQSKNVRLLKKSFDSLVRDINYALVKNDFFQLNIKTKLLALVYSALSEAQFVQILHTPSGFSHTEILKIKSERSLASSWKLMIDTAMLKVNPNWENIKDQREKRDEIIRLIETYIEKPQEIRNKIAHGQWEHALNSNGSKENENTTKEIQNLSVVNISIWAEVHQYLGYIIRDLVQSPKEGFHYYYWGNLVKLEEFLKKSKTWTLAKRKDSLSRRKANITSTITKPS